MMRTRIVIGIFLFLASRALSSMELTPVKNEERPSFGSLCDKMVIESLEDSSSEGILEFSPLKEH